MTLEHLAASRGSSRLIDVEPTNQSKSLDSQSLSSPILRKKPSTRTDSTSLNHQTDSLVDLKLTPTTSQSTTTGAMKTIYSILLQLIIISVKLYRVLKVYYLTAFYFVFELLIKHKFVSESRCDLDERFQLPKHVCVVFNDQSVESNDNERITNLYTKLADLLVSFDRGRGLMETLTFYKFDEVSSEVKERTLFNYKTSYSRVDRNNNNDTTDESMCESDFLQDLKSNGIINRHNTKKQPQQSKPMVKINFLSVEQGGKSIFVNACKSVAAKVRTDLLKSSDVNQQLVDNHILELSDMTEPHMLLSIGYEDTVAGFSPWHIRLSEIILHLISSKIPSYHLVNRFTIKNAILKYNKIEKRFGK